MRVAPAVSGTFRCLGPRLAETIATGPGDGDRLTGRVRSGSQARVRDANDNRPTVPRGAHAQTAAPGVQHCGPAGRLGQAPRGRPGPSSGSMALKRIQKVRVEETGSSRCSAPRAAAAMTSPLLRHGRAR